MESEDKKPIFTKKLILIILAVILLILIIFLLLRKCGGGDSSYKVKSITLSPTSVGIDKGQNYPIYAYVLPDDAKDKSIIWSSSDENVATVDAAGLVTGVNEGTATITATAGDGSGVTGQCIVTVGSSLPNLEQIQLNKSTYTVKVGKSVLVEVTPIPATAQLTNIQYSIADTSIATVDMYGTIKGVKKGTTTLTVTANNGGVTATAKVEVTKSSGNGGGTSQKPVNPTNIAVTGINLPTDGCYKLQTGNRYTLTAGVVPANATNQELKWESSDTSIATVTATGEVIASTKTGTVTIKVTAKSGVYSTYEIRVVSKSSKEGSCSSSNPGGGGNNGGGNNSGETHVTTSKPEEIKGDGVLTEAKVAPKYNDHTYNLTINGYIQSASINEGTDGWMQDANCSISINGILPPYYKATYQVPNGSEVEFRTRAYVSDITGPVSVRVYLYDRLVDSNGDLKLILNESKEVTVCGKVKGKEIKIDNQAPICDSIIYSGTTLDNSIVLTAHDEGSSGLHKVVWENGKTTSISDGTAMRSITSQFNAGTRKFVATIYDKAGNATSCGIDVTDLNGVGTEITGSADLTSTLKNIKLSVGNSNLFPGSTTTVTAMGEYADGTTTDITNSVQIDESSVASIIDLTGNTLHVVGNPDTMFGDSAKKTVTFKVTNGDKVSNSVTLTILKNGKVSCSAKPGSDHTGRTGTWYTGDAGAHCTPDDADTKITQIGACLAPLSGTCSPRLKSVSVEKGKTASASIGKVTGQGRICVGYKTNKSSETKTECFNNQNFDNTKPTCRVSIDGSVFMYKIDDGNDSSGLNQLTGQNSANLNGNANATTVNFRYTGGNKPASTDSVTDMAGNPGNCTVPTITQAQLEAMKKAEADEDANGQLYITQADVTGEMWVCQDRSHSLEDCPSNYELNSNATITFTVGSEVQTSRADSVGDSAALSILGALKKYDTDATYEWTSSNSNIIRLSSNTGKSVKGTPKGVGSAVITVCKKGTNKCATKTVTINKLTIPPKSMSVYHSATMALGVRETLSVSVAPAAAKKDVIITSSNSGVIGVENGNTIVARGVGKSTLTVKSAYNTSLSKTLTIEVIAKDVTKPTAKITTSQIITGPSGQYMNVYFQGNDTESNIKMNYNLVKGTSCSPTKTLDTSTRNALAAIQITSGGTYTACIEVIDAAENKVTSSQTITSTLPESGTISCSVRGTTSGQIEIGKSKTAIVTCTSNEEIKLNHANVNVSGIGARANISKLVTNSGSTHRAVFTVTIIAYAGGNSTLTLNAGALSTASKSSPSVKIGTYECVGSGAITDPEDPTDPENPTYHIGILGPSILAAGESATLSAAITIDFTPKTFVWTSSNKACALIDKTASNPTVMAAKVSQKCATTITLDATDANGNHAIATKTITVTPSPVQAPSEPSMGSLVKSDGSSYTLGTWSNKNLKATITSASGTTLKACHTTGSYCTPSSAQSSNSLTFNLTANGSGSHTYCAVAVKDGIESSVSCKTYNYKIDKKPPTCSFSLLGSAKPTNTIVANVTENESGVAAISSGWTTYSGTYRKYINSTGTYILTVKDNAGNQADCSVTITGQTQYNLNTCASYGYGTPTTTTVDSCTASGTKGTSYNYTTCTKDETTAYGYDGARVTGSCAEGGDLPILTPVNAMMGVKRFGTKNAAIDFCKDTLSNKCAAGQSLASDSCEKNVKEFTTTKYTKSTYQANVCNSWKAGSWSNSRPPSVGCTNITCNLKTRTVLAIG